MRFSAFARPLAGLLLCAGLVASASIARAADKPVKIGVLTDMNSIVADSVGKGSVVAAELAAEDSRADLGGRAVEIVSADSQLKADVASTIARRWYDVDGVDMITDLVNSGVALAVQTVARERGKIDIVTGAGSPDLYGKQCSPTGFLWVYDARALARALGTAVVAEGGKSWYFITADYVFGRQLEESTVAVVKAAGGTFLGATRLPQNAGDFSGPLTQAAASRAAVVGLAVFGDDAVNAIKQAHEFRLADNGQRVAAMLMFDADTHGVGLEAMQGTYVASAFYWNVDEGTRAFAERFRARVGRPPSMLQAGVYSATRHYLKAVAKTGTTDSAQVAAAMRAMPVDDFMTHAAPIRPDGRLVRGIYLLRTKTPATSKSEWDLYDVLKYVPGEELLPSVAEAGCPTAQATR
jgi:branched-chain amino acid transport system substrate-binding protein